jgi:LemA protein
VEYILLLLIIGIFAWGFFIHNRLVALRQAVKSSWAQIDVQLKRRKDLIPNLVAAVEGYMTHEKETLAAVIEARARAVRAGPQPTQETMKAEGELGAALSRLMMVSESYPDLKANQNVMSLMEELSSTENRLAFARQGYNDTVEQLNARIESVPDVFVNRAFSKVKPAEFWQVDEASRRMMEESPPEVKFGR